MRHMQLDDSVRDCVLDLVRSKRLPEGCPKCGSLPGVPCVDVRALARGDRKELENSRVHEDRYYVPTPAEKERLGRFKLSSWSNAKF